ncbi:RDD domain-containing protein [Mycolicibacterium cosmeticum]|uniref:RDD domain-containing protein n=1 Tax=Mycolicibacterium cosmeticum TaxID=258533 RepID=W9BKF6_MYCCO|nr:RDD domain-containing protein [Mycolicibacterium cosmeticum]
MSDARTAGVSDSRTAGVPETRTAGVVSRGIAAVIDLVVVGVVMAAIYLGLLLTRLMFHPAAFRVPTVGAVFSTAVLFVVAVGYLTACWAVSGCTVGSVTMGLRVTGRSGNRLTPAVALLRAVACVLLPVGLLWVAVDRRRRSLQDIVFGSRVSYVRP